MKRATDPVNDRRDGHRIRRLLLGHRGYHNHPPLRTSVTAVEAERMEIVKTVSGSAGFQ